MGAWTLPALHGAVFQRIALGARNRCVNSAFSVNRKSRLLPRALDNDEPVDIDALARALSSEAASRLSRDDPERGTTPEGAEEEAVFSGRPDAGFAASQSPFGNQAPDRMDAALRDLGVSPLQASDFVIFKELGSLQVQQMVAGDITGSFSETEADVIPSVVAYAATYETGKPFQGPVTVLLKEYLPGSCQAGVTELQVLSTMQALPSPELAWQAASRDMEDNGVVPAIGWFRADPTKDVPGYKGGSTQSVWVVYKWEALRPIVAYPSFPQAAPGPTIRLFERSDRTPLKLRHRMLRAIMQGALRAVEKCHQQGIVHGSLGTGSIMVNTFDDARADELVVKLDNFGFAQRIVGAVDSTADVAGPLVYGKKLDFKALAAALCEIVFCSLSREESPSTDAIALQRLVNDVFVDNIAGFRSYAENIDEWAEGVAFLEEVDGAGWDFMESLVQGEQSCSSLLESPFFSV